MLHPDGALEVTLSKECNFFITVGGTKLQFRYGTSVNGIIKSGSISRVSGVRFQVSSRRSGSIRSVTRATISISMSRAPQNLSLPELSHRAPAATESPICEAACVLLAHSFLHPSFLCFLGSYACLYEVIMVIIIREFSMTVL